MSKGGLERTIALQAYIKDSGLNFFGKCIADRVSIQKTSYLLTMGQ